jgi:hypothetical protein
MRIICATVLLFAMFHAACGQTSSAPNTTLTLKVRVSTPKSTVRLGEDVPLIVSTTNTGSKRLILQGDLKPELNYMLEVHDEKGGDVAFTKRGKSLLKHEGAEPIISSSGFFELQPGKSREERLILNQLFDLTQAGTYSIQLTSKDPDGNLRTKLNVVKITVVDPSKN